MGELNAECRVQNAECRMQKWGVGFGVITGLKIRVRPWVAPGLNSSNSSVIHTFSFRSIDQNPCFFV